MEGTVRWYTFWQTSDMSEESQPSVSDDRQYVFSFRCLLSFSRNLTAEYQGYSAGTTCERLAVNLEHEEVFV